MSDTVRLKDSEGNVHFTARGSQAADRLMRAGAVDLDAPADDTADTGRKATDAPASPAGDHDTDSSGGGPVKRQRTTRTAAGGDGAGQAQPGADR